MLELMGLTYPRFSGILPGPGDIVPGLETEETEVNKHPFALVRDAQCVRNIPDDGESVGEELAKAAERREKELREASGTSNPIGHLNDWSARRVSQLYFLAADAYDLGASVTLGHNRTDRYMARAKELRTHAEALLRQYTQ